MTHEKKVDAKAQEITRAFLRLKGYLNDDLTPTKMADGLIQGTPDNLQLTLRGRLKLQEMIKTDKGLFEFLGKVRDLNVSTKKLTALVIKWGIWQN